MTEHAREHAIPRPRLGALCTLAIALLAAALSLSPAAHAASSALSPLPQSDYTIRPVCPAPTPGRAGCLALQLVPITAQARAHTHPLGAARSTPQQAPSPAAGDYGLTPQDLHSAYRLPTEPVSPQTIAIVDAYNDPTAEADLAEYDKEFGLRACTAANKCLRQVNQNGVAGSPPFPASLKVLEEARRGTGAQAERAEAATGWGLELSLDMETAHAVCQTCTILLVLANSEENENLEAAERSAERLGANEITNSWGGLEEGESAELESESAFNHPGTVITASAGDNGYLGWDSQNSFEQGYAEFPSSSPHVVGVGGTRLTLTAGGAWSSETVWNGYGAGGGGCSVNFLAPAWQQSLANWSAVGCADKRAVSDVSADADPYTGLAVRYSSPACEESYEGKTVYWCMIGGTSLSSPLIASVFALAGGAGSAQYPAQTLYENERLDPGALHDIVSGSNGICTEPFGETGISGCSAQAEAKASCEGHAICLAGSGYDGPTGVGTPDGISAFQQTAETKGGEEGKEEKPKEEPREEKSKEPEQEAKEQEEGGGGSGSGPGGPSTEPPTVTPQQPPAATTSSSPSAQSAAVTTQPASTTAAATPAPASSVRITGLGLTARAVIALSGRRPRISQVGFHFTSSAAARVTVTLLRRRRVHGRILWAPAQRPLAISVLGGRASRDLPGHGALAQGYYRLTLAPAGGRATTLQFAIG